MAGAAFLWVALGACAQHGGSLSGEESEPRAASSEAVREAPPPALSTPVFDGIRLVGAAGNDVQRRWGAPLVAWREEGAQIWRYPFGRCALHLFLYERRPRPGWFVAHFDVTAAPGWRPECSAIERRLRADRARPATPPLLAH